MTVLIGLFAIVQAEAVLIFTVHGDGSLAQAQAAESAYLSSLGGLSVVTEHFEGFGAGTYSGDPGFFVTSVGTFVPLTPGNNSSGQACGTTCNDGLAILDASMSPYDGRFAVEGTSGHWLDSNDYKAMAWTPSTDVTSVGFFVTDINDVNALLRVQSFQPFSHGLDNGQIFYITVTDSAGMGGLQFLSDAGSSQNDGFGIDGFTIAGRAGVPEPDSLFLLGPGAEVPEPDSLFLLGAGVAGLAAWWRFRA